MFKPLITGNELSVGDQTLHWHIAEGNNATALGTVAAGSYAAYGSSEQITVDGDRVTFGPGASPGAYLILIAYINNPAISGNAANPPALGFGPNMFLYTSWASGSTGPNANNVQGCTGQVGETTFERAAIVQVSPGASGLVDPALSFFTVTLTTVAGYSLFGDMIVTKVSDAVSWGPNDSEPPAALALAKSPMDELLYNRLRALEDKYTQLLQQRSEIEPSTTVESKVQNEPSVRELLNQLAGKK